MSSLAKATQFGACSTSPHGALPLSKVIRGEENIFTKSSPAFLSKRNMN